MSDHPSDDERRIEEDDRLTRLSAELDAAELRDAERDSREQEKERAEQPDPAVISARR
jgi:hypothetical protein